MHRQSAFRRLSKWLFLVCGIWLIGLGAYFILERPPLLPEDLRYPGSSAEQVNSLSPHFASWLRYVFTVMGGFIAGFGVLTVFVSVHAVSNRLQGIDWAPGCAGLLAVTTMSAVNFCLDSDSKWLLLVPTAAWLLALLSFLIGSRTEQTYANAE